MSDKRYSAAEMKQLAAEAALQEIPDGCQLGLGSGSTAEIFVALLAERIRQGLNVRCCSTSERTTKLAEGLGIEIFRLERFSGLDLLVDGADEIDPQLNLIKGGGACHLREKVVADFARRMLVIADESKLVEQLGAFTVPLEVIPFALPVVEHAVNVRLSGDFDLRQRDGRQVISDEGNLICDGDFGLIDDPAALALALSQVPGLVEHGLFVGMADLAIIGSSDGVRKITRPA